MYRVIAVGAITFLLGCGGWAHMPPALVGPGAVSPSAESFQELVSTLRGLGYEARSTEPVQGQILLVASYRNRLGAEHYLTIQCFGDGWVRIVPSGPAVRVEGDSMRMPSALRDEIVVLAEALTNGGGPR